MSLKLICLLLSFVTTCAAVEGGPDTTKLTQIDGFQVVHDSARKDIIVQMSGRSLFSFSPDEETKGFLLSINNPGDGRNLIAVQKSGERLVLTMFVVADEIKKISAMILFDDDFDGQWDRKIVLKNNSLVGAEKFVYDGKKGWIQVDDKKGWAIDH